MSEDYRMTPERTALCIWDTLTHCQTEEEILDCIETSIRTAIDDAHLSPEVQALISAAKAVDSIGVYTSQTRALKKALEPFMERNNGIIVA
jgi:hypothetical protein